MKLCLGSAQFGTPYGISNKSGTIPDKELRKILKLCSRRNLKYIDTAIAYGDSEKRLGEADVGDFEVTSKLSSIPSAIRSVEQHLIKSVDDSLNRLNVGQLHGLLLHRPQELLGSRGEVIFSALQKLKALGKTRKIGISSTDFNSIETLTGRFDFDIVQMPMNLIDRRAITRGIGDRLAAKGIEVQIRSVFLQGALLMKREEIPLFLASWFPIFDEWHSWLHSTKSDPIASCLHFVLSQKFVSKAIVGVQTAHELNQIFLSISNDAISSIPPIECDDEHLIEPANWGTKHE